MNALHESPAPRNPRKRAAAPPPTDPITALIIRIEQLRHEIGGKLPRCHNADRVNDGLNEAITGLIDCYSEHVLNVAHGTADLHDPDPEA